MEISSAAMSQCTPARGHHRLSRCPTSRTGSNENTCSVGASWHRPTSRSGNARPPSSRSTSAEHTGQFPQWRTTAKILRRSLPLPSGMVRSCPKSSLNAKCAGPASVTRWVGSFRTGPVNHQRRPVRAAVTPNSASRAVVTGCGVDQVAHSTHHRSPISRKLTTADPRRM